MALASGTRLGSYEVVAQIGAGGMGEVYQAHDTKLGRDVAIKVLPQAFAHDTDRLSRFQREAKMLASLNHPNIATIHGLEQSDGIHYLVMELVAGQTLAERITKGALPLDETLKVAGQLAEALEAAHKKGIIHRDLKPANVKLTPEGRVKVLDFGLAKAFVGPGGYDLSDMATLTVAGTEEGKILGTPSYMSPEQARGRPLDERTDLFSFGLVLYEMVTGTRPVAAVRLSAGVPPQLEPIISKCLEGDREARYQHASDIRTDLKRLKRDTDSSGARVTTSAVVAPKHYAWWSWTLVALLVAGLLAWIVANRFGPTAQNPLANAQFTRLTNFGGAKTNPAISPDGKFAAFISNQSGTFDIWLIQANGNGLTNLTQGRIGDARAPLRAVGFSADGLQVWSAGIEGRRLMLWPLMGGAPHNFLDEAAAEVAWSPDGTRLVYHTWQAGDPTFVADHNGANQRQIVQNEPGLHNHYPVWSNDGRWIYFVRGRPATREMDLWRISPDRGEPEQLTHLNTDIAYPTPIDKRTFLFVAHNEDGAGPWLWAFDAETRTVRRVSSGLEQYTALAATADGQRLAASVVNPQVTLWSVPITSRLVEEQDVEAFQLPMRSWAPRFGGGSLFYLSSRDGADGLWSYREGKALEIWKGAEGALQSPAAVSADGKNVAFALRRDGKQQMHVMAADGTRLHALSSDVDVRGTASWSPDGKWIVVAGSDRNGLGLFKLPVDGSSPIRIATGPFLDPVWSPRGDLIVYCGPQVFTLAPLLAVHSDGTPAKLPEIKVHREGSRARFLPNGTALVYMLGNTLAEQDFWLLDLSTMHSRRLTRLSSSAVMRTFDITADGRRIVFDRLTEDSDILLIDLATNHLRP